MTKIYRLIALCAIALLMCGEAFADSKWGVCGGFNFNNVRFNQDMLTTDFQTQKVTEWGMGGQVGVFGELDFPGVGFGVDASLLYSTYGAKCHLGKFPVWSSDGVPAEFTYRTHNIEIPLDLLFKYRNLDGLEHIIAPMAFAGPSFTFCVVDNTEAIKTNTIDFTIHAGIGCELFDRAQLRVQYYFGVSTLCKTIKLDGLNAKRRGVAVRLIYFF